MTTTLHGQTIGSWPPVLTTYFGALKKLEQEGSLGQVIPIVRILPPWLPEALAARNVPALAPSAKLLSEFKAGAISWEQYTQRFTVEVLQPLDRFSAEQLRDRLSALVEHRTPILACWCKGADGQCHRHLVAEYFRSRGVQAWEYPLGRAPKAPKSKGGPHVLSIV